MSNNPPLNLEQKEALRRAAREVLATRPGIALPLSGIRRRIQGDQMVDFIFTDSDLRGGLSLLLAIDHVHMTHDALGSTEHFQASGAGVLAFERGQ